MKSIPLPAFQDNYLWVLHDGQRALVVDPGDAQPVLACLQGEGLQLDTILVTPHHPDHVGGSKAVSCTHEYTLSNPKFARAAEPGNLKLINDQQRCEELRAVTCRRCPGRSSSEETSTHSCARGLRPRPRRRATSMPPPPPDDVAMFAAIRKWKNEIK
jgi:glyoxylase-like metal-dependent hydrolase (beta-lactamase superfamily II)